MAMIFILAKFLAWWVGEIQTGQNYKLNFVCQGGQKFGPFGQMIHSQNILDLYYMDIDKKIKGKPV